MSRWQRIVVIGIVIVLLYELAASLGSGPLGIPYYRAIYGTWLIYAGVALVAGRAMNSVGSAALAAGVVGLVEATVGWWISWQIGPGRTETFSIAGAAVAIAMVTLLAMVIGAVVGLLVRQRPRRSH
ncbi:MAG: hypothetical protein V4558_03670 [Gemmatimonadota bacterium]